MEPNSEIQAALSYRAVMAAATEAYVKRTMEEHQNNMSHAAIAAGVSRQHWYKICAKAGVRRAREGRKQNKGSLEWQALKS